MKWLQFILSHSFFIAICAVALCYQTVQLLNLPVDIFLIGFVFFSTLSSYNFYWLLSKYLFLKGDDNKIIFITRELLQVLIFVISLTGALICFLFSTLQLLDILPALILTVLYSIPLFPFALLKKAGVIKTLLLAFTWTYVTAYIPLQQTAVTFNATAIFILSWRFLFMFMLCIIFDSRDIAIDKIRGLKSLATEMKPQSLDYLVRCIFALLFFTNFMGYFYDISIKHLIALQASTILLLATYFFSKKKKGYFFYYFFVDGLMLFSALATYIASI